MTKFTTLISEKNGRQRQIKVWIEDSTAELLLKSGDDELIHEYILEEYKARNINRKETRRHQSLESSMENGFDRPDLKADTEQILEKREDVDKLYEAMKKLLPSQRELIKRVYFEAEKISDIAREKGVDVSSICHRKERALKSLKKFMK